ncbi:divalent-cation tolerance protein CutA [Rhodospira trueperi]|uniref:Divalent cation tolerance protein n=1 Tax=Rhodospira trueperi TaxID=69960 RepID=A0A1G7DX19_9PROT|nr:divalent-cation tolerance protein CutA [Rhodospira trueperi]SDE56019.1 divalent cation tolerance protein [Rhodospira trueperi]
MQEYCLVYMTAGSHDEAVRIGHALVADRLAACVNVLGPMTSVFEWEGRTQEDQEVAFLAKTRRAQVDALVERVKALHAYDCPCAVALPIDGGNPAFLQWIGEQTGPQG